MRKKCLVFCLNCLPWIGEEALSERGRHIRSYSLAVNDQIVVQKATVGFELTHLLGCLWYNMWMTMTHCVFAKTTTIFNQWKQGKRYGKKIFFALPCATLLIQSRYLAPFSSYMYWPLPLTIFSGSSLKNSSTHELKNKTMLNIIFIFWINSDDHNEYLRNVFFPQLNGLCFVQLFHSDFRCCWYFTMRLNV